MDVVAVHQLKEKLFSELSKLDLLSIYELYRKAIPVTADIERYGIHFNIDVLDLLAEEARQELSQAEMKLRRIVGLETKLSFPALARWAADNLSKDIVASWPKTGKRESLSFSRNALQDISALDGTSFDKEFIQRIKDYSEPKSFLSVVDSSYRRHYFPKTGRIYTQFKLSGAISGRYTSSEPNLQNVKRESKIRALFRATPDKIFVGADFGQLELRCVAHLSLSEKMIQAYEKGKDLHRGTAALIANISEDEVTPEQRTAAKPVNFGNLYGQGATTLRKTAKYQYGVEMTEKEARAALKQFRSGYPKVSKWQNSEETKARQEGRTVSKCGKARKIGADRVYTLSRNHPVQAAAGEVMLHSLIILYERLQTSGLSNTVHIVSCIHDELILEIDDSEKIVASAKQLLKESMISGMLQVFPTATLRDLVDVKVGSSWAELK